MSSSLSQEIIFQNQNTNMSYSVQFQLKQITSQIKFSEILQKFQKHQLSSVKAEFYTFDTTKSNYIRIQNYDQVYLKYIGYAPIVIKYTQSSQILEQQENSNQIIQEKKERIKERSIRQVLNYVQKWRNIHKTVGQNGKKINLQEAAKMVGIPKKSLDDYYCKLRLGQKYGFDFEKHIDSKIGTLRNFIKQNKIKTSRSNKNEKHPKRLKMFEQFGQQISSPIQSASKQISSIQSSILVENQRDNNLTPMQIIQQVEYQNQFYQLSQLMIGEPIDPFVPYTAQEYRNFKKSQTNKVYNNNLLEENDEYQLFELEKFW